MDKTKLYEKKRALEIDRVYTAALVRSYEAKLDRVEPLSEEFEETVRGILEAQQKLREITINITRINLNIEMDEMDERASEASN